jgi:hypothetical protein
MAPFLELETSARFYGQVMDLWFLFRDGIGLDTLSYRYEDLTHDPEAVARRILEFLEVGWYCLLQTSSCQRGNAFDMQGDRIVRRSGKNI